MISQLQPLQAASQLRIVSLEGESRSTLTAEDLGPHSKLSEFYQAWYADVALARCKPSTLEGYVTTLQYWEQLTDNPSVGRITDSVIAKFASALAVAKYRRSKFGKEYPLSECSIAKHLRNMRAMMNRLGPRIHGSKPALAIVNLTPYVPVPRVEFDLKEPFGVDMCRHIAAHLPAFWERWELSRKMSLDEWRSMFAFSYYTGLRVGTIGNIRWKYLKKKNGEFFFDIPAHAVSKVSKRIIKAAHPQLLELIDALPKNRDHIVRWPGHSKELYKCIQRMQQVAEVPKEERKGWHALRRTHGTQLALMGLDYGMKVAQAGLHHSSVSVTATHYVDIESKLVRQLPLLF